VKYGHLGQWMQVVTFSDLLGTGLIVLVYGYVYTNISAAVDGFWANLELGTAPVGGFGVEETRDLTCENGGCKLPQGGL
jgi:hypothetical protein